MLSRANKIVSAVPGRALAAVFVPTRAKHVLPDLAYDYGALEPHISAEIMELHHSRHHATYVNNLNIAEEKYAEAQEKGTGCSTAQLLDDVVLGLGGGASGRVFNFQEISQEYTGPLISKVYPLQLSCRPALHMHF